VEIVCGRYAAAAEEAELVEEFRIDEVAGPLPPARFNIAPTDPVPAVWARPSRDTPGEPVRQLTTLRWGLVPSWASSPTGAARLINARLETVAEKPSFRKALAVRRCLLPAVGYYEWYTVADPAGGKSRKQPVFIRPRDGGLFVMAGLYEFWRDPSEGTGDGWLRTCTIITTRATDSLGHVHDRMPVTVPRSAWDDWLDRRCGAQEALALVVGERDERSGPRLDDLVMYAVSPQVNRVGNEGPDLIAALPGAGLPGG
jgi:putative SOS response-associated peptidase YedK